METQFINDAIKMLGALALILALIFVLAKVVLPKLNRGRQNGKHLRVIESVMLAPKTNLYLVEAFQKKYILAANEHHISCIDSQDAHSQSHHES